MPFDHNRLTPVEKTVEFGHEVHTCITCEHMQAQLRGGARQCVLQQEHSFTPADVVAGKVDCSDHEPMKGCMTG